MITTTYLSTLSPSDRQQKIIREFVKCKRDPIYCIENYFTVLDAEKGARVPFKLYPHQKRAIKDFETNPLNITMKTRQMGFTAVSSAYVAFYMCTKQNQVINALAQEKKTSRKFLRQVRETLDNARKTAPWLVSDYMYNNNGKDSFTLKTSCIITAEANKPDACRGDTINLLIIDEVAAISHMAEIWASAGLTLTKSRGKCIAISCVTDDTYVFTDKGLQQVKDFIPINIDPTIQQGYYLDEKYSVRGKDKLRDSDLFYCNGLSDVYKITTSYNEIKGSEKHKLWVYDKESNEYKIKKLKELTENDWVNIQYKQDIWGENDNVSDFDPRTTPNHKTIFRPTVLTPDICYFLGLYISEGSAYKVVKNGKVIGGSVSISCGDDITNIFEKLNLPYKTDRIVKKVDSLSLVRFLEYLGFDVSKHAHEKRIPERLLQCSKPCLVALLQGIFDGDGSSNSTNGSVSLASSSKELIDQVRMILLNLGCLSCTYKTTVENLNKNLPEGWYKFKHDGYSLQLYGSESVKYYRNIGFRLKRKQDNKLKLRSTKKERVVDILPNSKEIVKKLYSLTDLSPWKLATYKKIYISYDHTSRVKVEHLIDIIINENPALNTHPYILYLRDKVLIKNSIWTKIKTLEILPEKNLTYDFSLPHLDTDEWCHSVVYNGFLGEQTPKGASGWYFDQYSNAADFGWNVVEAHWSEHPDYKKGMYQFIKDVDHPEGGYIKFFNEDWPDVRDAIQKKKYFTRKTYPYVLDGRLRSPWYDYESKRLGIQKTRCELDCSFAGSGSEVLDAEVIRALRLSAKEVPALDTAALGFQTNGMWKTLKIYKEFNPDHGYFLSADPATGDGSDFSAISVIDLTTKELVATYKEHVDPIMFAKIIKYVATYFGKCMVMVEYQGPGLTVLLELKNNLRYTKLFYSTLKKAEPTRNQKRKIGFWQGGSTRELGGSKLEEVINTNQFRIYSEDLITEFDTWIWDTDGKRRHATGKNDDLILSLANAMFYIYYVLPKQTMNQSMMLGTFERVISGGGGTDTGISFDWQDLLAKTSSETPIYHKKDHEQEGTG